MTLERNLRVPKKREKKREKKRKEKKYNTYRKQRKESQL